jgi:hypothetical protein
MKYYARVQNFLRGYKTSCLGTKILTRVQNSNLYQGTKHISWRKTFDPGKYVNEFKICAKFRPVKYLRNTQLLRFHFAIS